MTKQIIEPGMERFLEDYQGKLVRLSQASDWELAVGIVQRATFCAYSLPGFEIIINARDSIDRYCLSRRTWIELPEEV